MVPSALPASKPCKPHAEITAPMLGMPCAGCSILSISGDQGSIPIIHPGKDKDLNQQRLKKIGSRTLPLFTCWFDMGMGGMGQCDHLQQRIIFHHVECWMQQKHVQNKRKLCSRCPVEIKPTSEGSLEIMDRPCHGEDYFPVAPYPL